ncbi:uncharacterized protein ColLi_01473 [Colletotrichum liriopes]|uniref:Glycine zipper 2TM domain-containing protein n=1 Tax=Colletotrichum liriopes TaxID=708192 RepID=A0AA37GD18_9PEZI|nr:uncharacterized protein ColLi_01473 [Colletotrichum liriopes]
MSAQDYYGGTRQNTHTPGGSSSRGGQYLAAPLIDQAGYRPRSANSDRPRSGSAFSSSSSHHRSRSTGPAGSDAQFGEDGERGLISTIGGGAAGGYAGKKFLGGKLGAVAGALGGAVVANKIEHRLSGSHGKHHGHHGHHGHHAPPPPPPPPHHYGGHHHGGHHHHHGPPPPPHFGPPHHGPPHHGSHHSSGGFGGLVGSLMGGSKHGHGHHGGHGHHHDGHHGHHGHHGW